ncbi:hypothetical protein ABBQ32_010138 [Trebouxia sp. C0010 RCD-2024]
MQDFAYKGRQPQRGAATHQHQTWLDEPPPEAGAYGSTNCSDPAHMHFTTEPSEAGSPFEQLSHQPTESLNSSTAQHGVSASQADADSHEPVATSGSGQDSPCSDTGPGNGSSASSVTETVTAEARNGIRGTLQELQAEDMFAAWYEAPPPPPPPARSTQQPKPDCKRCAAACLRDQPLITRLQTSFVPRNVSADRVLIPRQGTVEVLCGAKRLIQRLDKTCQQHPGLVAAAGVALAGAALAKHHSHRNATRS